jgi:hypothetical protein
LSSIDVAADRRSSRCRQFCGRAGSEVRRLCRRPKMLSRRCAGTASNKGCKISVMPQQRATSPSRRARDDGSAIDHRTDELDRTQAAIHWLHTLRARFTRIAARHAEIGLRRAKRNGS